MSVVTEEKTGALPEVVVVGEEEARRREVLLRAAEIIEERGWCRGSQGMRVEGPYCILGAVAHAMNARTRGDGKRYGYHQACRLLGTFAAWGWNDFDCDGGEVASRVLRAMANGASWKVATAGTKQGG